MTASQAAARCWVVVPAAGRGERMQAGVPKQYLPLAGATVIEHALRPFLDHPRIDGIVVVLAPDDTRWPRLPCATHVRVSTAVGGARRIDSVSSGLHALTGRAASQDWVLVHDAARPCFAREDLDRLLENLDDDPVGGLPAIPLSDTIKRADARMKSVATVERTGLWAAQTPQAFRFEPLRLAVDRAAAAPAGATDEASAMEAAGLEPRLFAGSSRNIKITRPEDVTLAEAILAPRAARVRARTGTGFDVHAFGTGDHVMLGGVRVPHARGVVAHSDGDVLLHALCDALLGAAGLGDIGQHFPDSDPRWRGAPSRLFVDQVMELLAARRFRVVNADLTLLAEEPRVGAHRAAIVSSLADALRVSVDAVNLKATTMERMGFIGRGEGLGAMATVLLEQAE